MSAPNLQYLTEDGVVGPEAQVPFDPLMTMISSRANYRALQWGTMNYAADLAHLGYVDYGILATLQVDRYGNVNSTVIGKVRGWRGAALRRSRRGRQHRGARMAHHSCDRSAEAQICRSRRFHFVTWFPRWSGRARASWSSSQHGTVARLHPVGDVWLRRRLSAHAAGHCAVRQRRAGVVGNEFQAGHRAEAGNLEVPTEEELTVCVRKSTSAAKSPISGRWIELADGKYRFAGLTFRHHGRPSDSVRKRMKGAAAFDDATNASMNAAAHACFSLKSVMVTKSLRLRSSMSGCSGS